MKLKKIEITDADEVILPKFTYCVEKWMCEVCGLTKFIVDNHTNQINYCSQCGQPIEWS